MTTIDGASVARVAAVLEGAQRIAAVGHVRPDGDALGSIVGLALAARAVGKRAWASFGDPFVVPNEFSFLDLSVLCPAGELPDDLDVLVACDTAARDRLGTVQPLIDQVPAVVVIDHHVTNDGFGHEALISPDAAATTQLVYHVLVELGWPIDERVAAALYTGLVTDTGRFQYSSTSPEVHRIAAELLGTGLDSAAIGRHLYEEVPFGYLELASRVLERAVLDPEIGLVWSVLLRSDLAESGIQYEDADALIDLVRIAEEAGVACLLKELGPDRFKGSLRSRGAVDVSAIAAGFGGGGHHNAAGFTHKGTAEEAIARVSAGLR